ncbi:hypothetical protein GCM10010869_63530 [Mesorhizobium tianshanense]|nr:hypothetical protein GCM10010869_63530 [Mesorhizobium tianshanense]
MAMKIEWLPAISVTGADTMALPSSSSVGRPPQPATSKARTRMQIFFNSDIPLRPKGLSNLRDPSRTAEVRQK